MPYDSDYDSDEQSLLTPRTKAAVKWWHRFVPCIGSKRTAVVSHGYTNSDGKISSSTGLVGVTLFSQTNHHVFEDGELELVGVGGDAHLTRLRLEGGREQRRIIETGKAQNGKTVVTYAQQANLPENPEKRKAPPPKAPRAQRRKLNKTTQNNQITRS